MFAIGECSGQSTVGSGNSYFLFYFIVEVEYLFLKDWRSWLAMLGNRTLFICVLVMRRRQVQSKLSNTVSSNNPHLSIDWPPALQAQR